MVQDVLFANRQTISVLIQDVNKHFQNGNSEINLNDWNHSKYSPTPTIIEAAQTLYSGQSVSEISRSHAGAENLSITTTAILEAIKQAQESNSKIICFEFVIICLYMLMTF